ncbi:MAG: MFS transporter [Bacteroidales bacterium]|nr:MFS transporter [Bacteroidales bacterium]
MRPVKLASLTFAHFVHDVYTAFFAPLLPKIKEKLELSYFSIGLLYFIQQLPSFLMPLIGIISNRPYAKYFVIFAPAVASLVMSFIGVVDNWFLLAVILFVGGINSALFHVPSPVMIKNVSGKNTGLGMSMYMVGGELSRTLGPLIIMAAVTYWGLEGTWRLFPFGIVSSFILFLILRDVELTSVSTRINFKRIVATLKRNRFIFLMILGFTVFRAIAKTSLSLFLPVYLNSKTGDYEFSVVSLTILEAGGVAGVLLSGIISDYLSRKKILIAVSIISPTLMLLFMIVENPIFSTIILVFLGFFVFAATPVVLSYIMKIKSHYPAFLNSLYMTISFIGTSVAVFFIGNMADLVGLETTYWISGFIALGAIPFAVFLPDN